MRKRLTVFATLTLMVAVVVHAETLKPMPRIGDWCEYQNDRIGRKLVVIMEVSEDGSYVQRVSSSSGDLIRKLDRNGRMLAKGNTIFSPFQGGPVFPLDEDVRRGEVTFSWTHPAGKGTVTATTKVTAVTYEKVTVLVGTFDAVKVETETAYHVSGNNYRNKFFHTVWYSVDQNSNYGRGLKSYYVDFGRPEPETEMLVKCGDAASLANN